MATYHINDGGTSTSPYDTWATAANLLSTPSKTNKGVYLIDYTHTDSYAASTTFAFYAAALNSWSTVISGTPDTGSGITASTPGATIQATSSYTITITGSVYVEGVKFELTSGAYIYLLTAASAYALIQEYKNCTFTFNGTTGYLQIGSSTSLCSASIYKFVDCTIEFDTQALIQIYDGIITFERVKFVKLGSTATQTTILNGIGSTGYHMTSDVTFIDCDFSALTSLTHLAYSCSVVGEVKFINCKFATGLTLQSVYTNFRPGARFSLIDCFDGASKIKNKTEEQAGIILEENTIVKDNGAYDGANQFSVKMSTGGTYVGYPMVTLDLAPMLMEITSYGSAITLTVDILIDSTTGLTNADIWLEVEFPSALSSSVSGGVSGGPSGYGSTPTTWPTSTATWTTTGLTNPLAQKMSVTFTPQRLGFIKATVRAAILSTVIYVDPAFTLS